MPTLTTFTQHVLQVLATAIRQEKESKLKLSLFAENMILNIQNPKDITKKLSNQLMNSIKLKDTNLIYGSLFPF